jgi:ATP-binding cassette subfamily B protein
MKHLFLLNKYLWKYRASLLLGVLFILLTNLFTVYSPRVVRFAFDMVKESAAQLKLNEFAYPDILIQAESLLNADLKQFFDFSDRQNTIESLLSLGAFLATLYFAIYVIKGIFLFLTRQTIIVVSRKIEFDLKNEIFNHYQKLSASFYKQNSTGDLMNRISEDVSHVRMYLGPGIMYTVNLFFLFIFTIIFMLNVNVELTFYVLLPLPVMSVLIYKVSNIINKKSEAVQRQQSKLSTLAQESFSGIRVLKAYNKEDVFSDNFTAESEVYKKNSLELVKVNALFFPIIIVLIGLSTIISVYVGGIKAIDGDVTLGNIAEFIIYVNMLTWPFATLGWVTSVIQRAAASMERIDEFLSVKPDITWEKDSSKTVDGDIEFKNATFTYKETGITAISNLSLKIKKGETVAIMGATGSGKTTVINLLSRLFDLDSGSILIDGKDIKDWDMTQLRKGIGMVPQDVFLFSDSVANNIAFGIDAQNVEQEEIIRAAKKAEVHENIMGFKKQYDTIVGERGITLSGGQKQRISIARAIIKDPNVLILDDSLSAVDTETEDNILTNLSDTLEKKTTILISHRVSTAKNADRILIIENGKISEMGSHESLLESRGYYFELYEKQLKENQEQINP